MGLLAEIIGVGVETLMVTPDVPFRTAEDKLHLNDDIFNLKLIVIVIIVVIIIIFNPVI